ncbi:MAG: hypothetical protein GX606_05090 [Elusimicrobia bacterium]|nr:hypothetical protein [Elusimicrobiota bacterium]
MSIFWDPRQKKPQPWIYVVFLLLVVALLALVYGYGMKRAEEKGIGLRPVTGPILWSRG